MEVGKITRSRGFTVLELMFVLMIGSILMFVGVPGFQRVVADQRSTTTVNELIESMILARSEAIKRGRYVSVCASQDGAQCIPQGTEDVGWNNGWIIFSSQSSATPGVVDPGDEVLRVHQALPDSLEFKLKGNVGNFISFRPVGTAGTTGMNFLGTLVMCHKYELTPARGLIISPSGRIQVSRDVDHADNQLDC